MNAEKILNEAMKREARKSICDWAKNELSHIVLDEAEKIAKEWMRENRAFVSEVVHSEMEKRVKYLAKRASQEIGNSLRY